MKGLENERTILETIVISVAGDCSGTCCIHDAAICHPGVSRTPVFVQYTPSECGLEKMQTWHSVHKKLHWRSWEEALPTAFRFTYHFVPNAKDDHFTDRLIMVCKYVEPLKTSISNPYKDARSVDVPFNPFVEAPQPVPHSFEAVSVDIAERARSHLSFQL